jgi:hypothetical protein
MQSNTVKYSGLQYFIFHTNGLQRFPNRRASYLFFSPTGFRTKAAEELDFAFSHFDYQPD